MIFSAFNRGSIGESYPIDFFQPLWMNGCDFDRLAIGPKNKIPDGQFTHGGPPGRGHYFGVKGLGFSQAHRICQQSPPAEALNHFHSLSLEAVGYPFAGHSSPSKIPAEYWHPPPSSL